jgi:hypothetical protein
MRRNGQAFKAGTQKINQEARKAGIEERDFRDRR